jgi:hypothetical protein
MKSTIIVSIAALLPFVTGCEIPDTFVQGIARQGNMACEADRRGDETARKSRMSQAQIRLDEAGAHWRLPEKLDCEEYP